MQEEPLVLAIPRRPLYGLAGMTTRIDLAILSALSDEGWFATRSAIAENVDSKEVRMGLVVLRREPDGLQALVGDGGVLVRVHDVPAEVGCALVGLKNHARSLAMRILPGTNPGVELAGYLNEDSLPEWRRVFLLAYRAVVPAGAEAPAGTAWVSKSAVGGLDLDAVSRRTLAALG